MTVRPPKVTKESKEAYIVYRDTFFRGKRSLRKAAAVFYNGDVTVKARPSQEVKFLNWSRFHGWAEEVAEWDKMKAEEIRKATTDPVWHIPPPLPSVKSHWVYCFVDENGISLYVGCTSNPARRLMDHRRNKDWWDKVKIAKWHRFKSLDEARYYEGVYIRGKMPLFNVYVPPS